jgi:hypothetical protein
MSTPTKESTMDVREINLETRVGRQLEALIGSTNKRAKVVLTVDLQGAKRYHQTFQIRRWTNRQDELILTVEVRGSGDYAAGVWPIKVTNVNTATGEVYTAKDERNADPLLRYAANAALMFAFTGQAPTPANGTVAVVEEAVCGHCGMTLTDPVSIERGIGPTCHGKTTGTKTILGRSQMQLA